MIQPDSTPPSALRSSKEIADLVQSLLTSTGILIGGGWAYFKYLRGHTFGERLEVTAHGTITRAHSLSVTLQAKNVGLSKVPVVQEGSGLRISAYVAQPQRLETEAEVPGLEATWRRLETVPIFESDKWIDPGETIREQRLFTLPDGVPEIVKLELFLQSKKFAWHGSAVVTPEQTR